MLFTFARNQQLVAMKQTVTQMRLDAIPVGDSSQAQGVLVIHQIVAAASNVAALRVFVDTSNDGIEWVLGASAVVEDVVAVTRSFNFGVVTEYFRLRIELDPADSGTDDGPAIVLFDLRVRTYQP